MAPMKQCFKCLEIKPLTSFYAHPQTADGHLNKCKECTKRDVKARYKAKPQEVAHYDQERQKTIRRRALKHEYRRKNYRRNRIKHLARLATKRAIRSGQLKRTACEVCGEPKTEAHHIDYTKPLEVRWLCFRHHREAHGQRMRLESS